MASVFRPTVIRYVDQAGKQVSKGTPGAKRVREKSLILHWSEATAATTADWLADYIVAKQRGLTIPRPPFEVHGSFEITAPKCHWAWSQLAWERRLVGGAI